MTQKIIRTIKNFFYYHSFWLTIATIVGFVAVWAVVEYYLYKRAKGYRIFNFIMLGVSVYLILSSTLFDRVYYVDSLSLVPFSLFARSLSDPITFMSMVLNVILFIPFGMFGCSAFRCTTKKSAAIFLAAGVGFSVFIEAIQFAFSIGQAEIDDVICNSLGILIGILFYYLHYRFVIQGEMFKKLRSKDEYTDYRRKGDGRAGSCRKPQKYPRRKEPHQTRAEDRRDI